MYKISRLGLRLTASSPDGGDFLTLSTDDFAIPYWFLGTHAIKNFQENPIY